MKPTNSDFNEGLEAAAVLLDKEAAQSAFEAQKNRARGGDYTTEQELWVESEVLEMAATRIRELKHEDGAS